MDTALADKNKLIREQLGAAHLSIAGAAFIFLVSLIVGIMTDSMTLLLDAGTGMVILFVAFFVRVMIKKINSPPDHLFNFGYEKYEPFVVVLQNTAIMITCLVALKFAIQDVIHPDDMTNYNIPVAASFISALMAMGLGFYLRAIGRRANAGVLKTSAIHWFSDSALSFAMCAGFLFGLIMHSLGHKKISPYVDPVMAIILSLVIMKIPARNITINLLELLDAVPAEEMREKIKQAVERCRPKNFGVHRMRFRKAGKRIFLDIGFIVRGEAPVKEVEAMAERFEKDLVSEFPHCDVVVYFKSADRQA